METASNPQVHKPEPEEDSVFGKLFNKTEEKNQIELLIDQAIYHEEKISDLYGMLRSHISSIRFLHQAVIENTENAGDDIKLEESLMNLITMYEKRAEKVRRKMKFHLDAFTITQRMISSKTANYYRKTRQPAKL